MDGSDTARLRVLITGATGFIGRSLIEYLSGQVQQLDLYGTTRWRSTIDRITDLPQGIQLIECDLTDYESVLQLINRIRPNIIFHLAGQSHVPASWMSPNATLADAMNLQLNLLNALKFVKAEATFITPVSSQTYGMVSPADLPITGNTSFNPLSPLGMGHAIKDMVAQHYYTAYGISTIRVRLFELLGPNQPDLFLFSGITKQMAEAEAGQRSPLVRVANLQAMHDWTDVRDIVRGLWLIAERGKPGQSYVLASEQRHSRSDLCALLKQMTSAPIEFRDHTAPNPEPDALYGSSAEFRQLTGWEPQIKIQQSLQDLLNHWRFQVKFVDRLGQLLQQAQHVSV